MDRGRLDILFDRAVVDLLSDRIVAALKTRARSALVLFSGTDLGLEPAIRALSALADAGWRFDIRRSRKARALITPERLRTAGGGALVPALADADDRPDNMDLIDPETVLARHSVVIVPTLSIALAARTALGLADSDVSQLLAGAIERNMRIVAARDGCCPASRERIARGLTANAAYREMASGHLGRLEAYGIELTWAARLDQAVAGTRAPASTDVRPAAEPQTNTAGVFGWTAAKAVAGEELRLSRNVLVTPLAAEELKARHVRLVRE
ncbi:hypothetical protein CH339_19855 [Rhodobium orientis]|uniref:Flavoprotein domain-containing protein n=2 Tax=Rhodobium orientis TaxID=34017 RepID=A0A327JIM2_9HYPH|nr:hypothetical protein [Rhodobium orientis]RAI25063.1 hypothetical protein CH339_19855 [Rhodobium orientis]